MSTSHKDSITRPKIGISACFFHADPTRALFKNKTLLYVEQSCSHWVQSAGAIPVLIPTLGTRSTYGLSHLVAELDGLILAGGEDLAPQSYGEIPLKKEWGGDAIRDAYELGLVAEFKKQNKPILGLCRGNQLINVALGGTLYQDINTQVEGSFTHRNWDLYEDNLHEIEIKKDSFLSQLYKGKLNAQINSIHHQAIKDVGQGLIVQATSKTDGIIESVYYDGEPFVFGCQWHPEMQDPSHLFLLDGTPMLDTFIKAASKQ